MYRQSLLTSAILFASTSALATPYMPMDARGLGMGSTGVAGAKYIHAQAYNPALLTSGKESDDFGVSFPQFGANFADEQNIQEDGDDISDNILPRFEDLFENGQPNNLPDAVDGLTTAAETLAEEIQKAENNNPSADVAGASEDFGNAIEATQASVDEVNEATSDLTTALDGISGSPLRGRFGVAGGVAVPNKSLAVAVGARVDANVSARTLFSANDQRLLTAYGLAASDYLGAARDANESISSLDDNSSNAELAAARQDIEEFADFTSEPVETAAGQISIFENGAISSAAEDPRLDSVIQVAAIAVAEVGVSLAREFAIDGRQFSVGVTPKMQAVSTYHYVGQLDEEDNGNEIELEDSERTENHINLDVGTSFFIDNDHRARVGVVIKDLIAKDFELADVPVDGNAQGEVAVGGTVSLSPKIRAGINWNGGWYQMSADLDLTENEPVAFEDATQFLAIGAELDAAGWAQLRAGLRTNLAGAGNLVTLGAGVSPFGLHMDLALLADFTNPEAEVGGALELGLRF